MLPASAQSNSSPTTLRRLADEYYNWRNQQYSVTSSIEQGKRNLTRPVKLYAQLGDRLGALGGHSQITFLLLDPRTYNQRAMIKIGDRVRVKGDTQDYILTDPSETYSGEVVGKEQSQLLVRLDEPVTRGVNKFESVSVPEHRAHPE